MLKWVRSFRAMSSLRKGAPPPRMKKKNSDTIISNGNGGTSLYYPNDPPDDENMNEIADENVDLTVLLPEGKVRDTSVNSNIPMMDLLVNLAARNKLSPAGYTIVVLNEETRKPMDYKPNQTVGSLCPKNMDGAPRHLTVQLAPKKMDSEKQRNTKNAQPFEMTYRFTVNLPQNQKKVLRISPSTLLEDVHRQICSEKNLDPFRYTFHLPSDPYTKLSMQMTVGELKSNEINLAAAGPVNSAMSMPNLAATDRSQSVKTDYMPTMGESKKKKGFFSFLKKDNNKKFNLQSVHREAFVENPAPLRDRMQTRSASEDNPPEQRTYEGNPGARPKTMYAVSTSNLDKISESRNVPPLDLTGINNSENASSKSKSLSELKKGVENDKGVVPPHRKKRRAPAPPQAQAKSVPNTVQVEISVEKTNKDKIAKSKIETNEIRQRTENVSKFHSRNSSDSSGYHELTLSGAESPDGPRIDENFETNLNLETASLDSDGHLNGDSGIRDISPPSSRRIEINSEVGSSYTLPLERVKKTESLSTPRSNSLDRTGKKKKAAPPPPPGCPPKPPEQPALSSKTPTKKDDSIAINAVLDSLDQDLDDHDTSDTGMMVENSSIHSEDIDADLNQTHPPRPCAFIAPPPPLEPPPDDTEPVDYNMIMNRSVDTVDVGVETSDDSTSYGPVSTRSSTDSPVSRQESLVYWEDNVHSRAESQTSISSVNTVDDVSLDFERTIAACEEEVLRAEQENPTYKTEMAQFVEKMKEMTVDRVKHKKDQMEKAKSSDEAVYIFPKNGNDSVEMENVPETLNGKKEEPSQEVVMRKKEENPNREVAEITYDFRISAVPPEFQSEIEAPEEVHEEKEDQKEAEEEEEEEEEVITETIEIIYPSIQPLVEPETEKELVEKVENVPEISKHIVEEEKPVLKENKPVVKPEKTVESKPVLEEKPKEPEKPKPKEEFVLTFDDLSNVDFSLMRKKKKITPKPKPTHHSTPTKRHTVSSVDELKSGFSINSDNVFITPCKEHTIQADDGSILTEHGSVRGHKGEVKTKCSELSFSPSSEGEMEHVLEEKSISMINLPAVRNNQDSSVEADEIQYDKVVVSKTEIVFSTKPLKDDQPFLKKLTNDIKFENSTGKSKDELDRHGSVSSSNEKSVNDSGVDTIDNSESEFKRKGSTNSIVNDSGLEAEIETAPVDTQEVVAAQYKQLQEQFSVWKKQLAENQKLLSSQSMPADDTSRQFQQQLQSQIQLQQQMIQQMQQSMETLATQQQQQNIDQSKSVQISHDQSSHVSQKQSLPQIEINGRNHVEQKAEHKIGNGIPPAPNAPALPNGKFSNSASTSSEQPKPRTKSKSRKHIEPKLDPREELMIAIRNFGGRSAMKKVPVNKTHWHAGIP